MWGHHRLCGQRDAYAVCGRGQVTQGDASSMRLPARATTRLNSARSSSSDENRAGISSFPPPARTIPRAELAHEAGDMGLDGADQIWDAGRDQPVSVVDGGCVDPHEHPISLELGLVDVVESQDVAGSVGVLDDRFHRGPFI